MNFLYIITIIKTLGGMTMKFKKIVALSSALLVASMSLVGCSNKTNNEQSDNKNNKSWNGSRCRRNK